MSNFQNKIERDGYFLINNLIDKKLIKNINLEIKKLKPKIFLPNTNIPWGFGNLLENKVFKKILEIKILEKCLIEFFKSRNYIFNHLILQNKAPWFGPSVEWHQEIYNINTYAPGYNSKDWRNFLQIYIAIDNQDEENGCLKVFQGSHKHGVRKNLDIINEHLNHKRSIKYDELIKVSKKCKLIDCKMKPGDALIFNHMLLHGSPSNYSHKPRRSLVLQARKNIKIKKTKIYLKETKRRSNFIINKLNNKILNLKQSDLYKDFKK